MTREELSNELHRLDKALVDGIDSIDTYLVLSTLADRVIDNGLEDE